MIFPVVHLTRYGLVIMELIILIRYLTFSIPF
jgi:hypothetical protein